MFWTSKRSGDGECLYFGVISLYIQGEQQSHFLVRLVCFYTTETSCMSACTDRMVENERWGVNQADALGSLHLNNRTRREQ